MTTTPLPPLPDASNSNFPSGRAGFRAPYGPAYTADQMQAYATQARADLEAENQRLREALERAELFIDEVRQDLHHERIADWYPEGAHSSAAAMSESMRVIGNRCADFEAEAALKEAP